jgi:hypothetical protein
VLELRHVFFRRRLLRELPRQHEFGLEHGAAACKPAVKGCRHPAERRMTNSSLNIGYGQTGIGLVPAPVENLGGNTKLYDQVAR